MVYANEEKQKEKYTHIHHIIVSYNFFRDFKTFSPSYSSRYRKCWYMSLHSERQSNLVEHNFDSYLLWSHFRELQF